MRPVQTRFATSTLAVILCFGAVSCGDGDAPDATSAAEATASVPESSVPETTASVPESNLPQTTAAASDGSLSTTGSGTAVCDLLSAAEFEAVFSEKVTAQDKQLGDEAACVYQSSGIGFTAGDLRVGSAGSITGVIQNAGTQGYEDLKKVDGVGDSAAVSVKPENSMVKAYMTIGDRGYSFTTLGVGQLSASDITDEQLTRLLKAVTNG